MAGKVKDLFKHHDKEPEAKPSAPAPKSAVKKQVVSSDSSKNHHKKFDKFNKGNN